MPAANCANLLTAELRDLMKELSFLREREAREAKNRVGATITDTAMEDDCNGWGKAKAPKSTIVVAAVQKERGLMRLCLEVQTKGGRLLTKLSSGNYEAEERDLFIPIFALVLLAGLFGSYGYEILRLFSSGELYLPWDNK